MNKSNLAMAANMDCLDNPFKRLPVCLCLDISASMISNDKINQLNKGMALFYKSIEEDEITANMVEIAVVTFGEFPPAAKCVRDFSIVDFQQTPPVLNASGYTPLGEGVNLAMASGTLRHARIPYGYLKDDKTGNLVIDPEKAMIVRRIFDMYIGGMGIKRIAVQLNEEGIPSPTGIQWNNITINKMLRQEKYIGDTLWQKTYSEFMGKKYQTNYGQQTKYYLRDTHPAIVSREDFAKVAEIKKKQAAPKGELIVSPFRKKLICGKCGHSYSSSNYLNNLSWHCGFRNNVPALCDNITVRDRTLHFAFRAMCDKLHTHGAKIFGTCIHELKS